MELGRKWTLPSPPFAPDSFELFNSLWEGSGSQSAGKIVKIEDVCISGSSSLNEVCNEEKRPNLHTVVIPGFQYFLENLLHCPAMKAKFIRLERECELGMKYSLYIVMRTFTRRGKFCSQNCFSSEIAPLIVCMN